MSQVYGTACDCGFLDRDFNNEKEINVLNRPGLRQLYGYHQLMPLAVGEIPTQSQNLQSIGPLLQKWALEKQLEKKAGLELIYHFTTMHEAKMQEICGAVVPSV